MSWETFLEISTHTDCTKTPAYLPSRMLLILEEKVSLEISYPGDVFKQVTVLLILII